MLHVSLLAILTYPVIVQGQPYCAAGVIDLLALFRCISCRYCFSTDLAKPELLGAPGRVFTSRQVSSQSMGNGIQLILAHCRGGTWHLCPSSLGNTFPVAVAGDDPQCAATEQGCIFTSTGSSALQSAIYITSAPVQVSFDSPLSNPCFGSANKHLSFAHQQAA